MKWFAIYLIIGLFVYEFAKRHAIKEYNTIIEEFPEYEPYLPIIFSFLWFPVTLMAIISIINGENYED